MERPVIKLPYSTPEKALQILCAFALVLLALRVGLAWGGLPSTVATHFDASGRPDAWGGKGSLWALPVITAIMAAGLTVLERFPQIYNLPCKVTQENAPEVYRAARGMIVWLKLILILTFGYMEHMSIQTALGAAGGLGVWFLPLSLGGMAAVIAVFIVKIVRAGRGQ